MFSRLAMCILCPEERLLEVVVPESVPVPVPQPPQALRKTNPIPDSYGCIITVRKHVNNLDTSDSH